MGSIGRSNCCASVDVAAVLVALVQVCVVLVYGLVEAINQLTGYDWRGTADVLNSNKLSWYCGDLELPLSCS